MGSPRRTSARAALVLAALVLAVLLGGLVVAGIVLGVVDGRATARADDEAAAVAAVRARLEAGPAPAGSAVVIRAVGLESLDGDSARAFAAARLTDGTTQRAWRVVVGLTRQDGRWLVDDVAEVP